MKSSACGVGCCAFLLRGVDAEWILECMHTVVAER